VNELVVFTMCSTISLFETISDIQNIDFVAHLSVRDGVQFLCCAEHVKVVNSQRTAAVLCGTGKATPASDYAHRAPAVGQQPLH